jgi:hypothetical protein
LVVVEVTVFAVVFVDSVTSVVVAFAVQKDCLSQLNKSITEECSQIYKTLQLLTSNLQYTQTYIVNKSF